MTGIHDPIFESCLAMAGHGRYGAESKRKDIGERARSPQPDSRRLGSRAASSPILNQVKPSCVYPIAWAVSRKKVSQKGGVDAMVMPATVAQT